MTTWIDNAACRGLDPNIFYPDLDTGEWDKVKAEAICASCPVRVNCIDCALRNPKEEGYWGSTPTQRKKLRGLEQPIDLRLIDYTADLLVRD